MKKEIIGIFGGSGFVGIELVSLLCKSGYRMKIFSRNAPFNKSLKLIGELGQVTSFSGNVSNAKEVERFINLSGDINGIVEIANDNAPGQVVISGNTNEVNKVSKIAKDGGAKATINLQVSAPFHCSLMEPAKIIMSEALKNIEFTEPTLPVISNVSAIPETAPNILKENLIS